MLQGGGASCFKWRLHPGYLKYLRFFVKNLRCLLFFLVQVIILAIICDLPYLGFSYFTVKVLKDFRVIAAAREKDWLVPLNAIPTGRPTPLANTAIKTPPVITVDVIRLVSTMLVIFLNRLIFFASRSRTSISSSKYASISVNFFNRYACGSCGTVGFRSG